MEEKDDENQPVISPVAKRAEVTALTPECRRFLLHAEEPCDFRFCFSTLLLPTTKRNFSRKLYTGIQKEQ